MTTRTFKNVGSRRRSFLDSFSNFDEFISAASAPRNPEFVGESSRRAGSWGDDWSMTPDYESAQALALNGWTDIASKVSALAEELERKIERKFANTYETRYDVGGIRVDIARYLEGEPENMIAPVTLENERQGGKAVTIVVPFQANYRVSADVLVARGVAVLALVSAIERLGGSARIIASASIESRATKNDYTTAVVIKEHFQLVDRDRIMFALAHPAMLRRIWFAQLEAMPTELVKGMGFDGDHAYGTPVKMSGNVLETLHADKLLPFADHTEKASDYGMAWVLNELKTLGFTVND